MNATGRKQQAANTLARKFAENFAKKYPDMPENIVNAGPKAASGTAD